MIKPKAIIIDLDGTLCESPYRASPDMVHWKDYWPLYKHIPEDLPQEWCMYLVDRCIQFCKIVFLTARPEHTKEETIKWLGKNSGTLRIFSWELIMMPDDYSIEKSVTDYKREEVKKLQEKYDILFGIDDNESVCEMFEQEGIKALFCGVKNE